MESYTFAAFVKQFGYRRGDFSAGGLFAFANFSAKLSSFILSIVGCL